MQQLQLKYGCNPNQTPSRIFVPDGELPVTVLNGRPGYINFLDALNGWQLVRELRQATGIAAATSFKHVSPAGAAVGLPLSETERNAFFVPDSLKLTEQAAAYARARGADRISSFGDWVALSSTCDEETALLLKSEISDGIIAPEYTEKALEILKSKRKGGYNIVRIDPDYRPPALEQKQVFGIIFEQGRNEMVIDERLLAELPTKNKRLTGNQKRDLIIALITLKYTQSNSVCYAKNGQAIGIGAGQQSRIHCTRLAGNKADNWHLRQAPEVLNLAFAEGIARADRDNVIDVYVGGGDERLFEGDNWKAFFKTRPERLTAQRRRQLLSAVRGVALASDAFFPFGDNIERAHRSGVDCIVQPGGSIRDDNVIAACDQYDIAMAFCGTRLFHH